MSAPSSAVGVPFEIHIIGDVTGKAWPGKFRAKEKLTFRDKLNADRFRRELIGDASGNGVDPEAAASALIIAQLGVRLTEFPEWWKDSKGGLELEDANILEKVYNEAMKVETDYLKRVVAEGEAARTALREDKKA